MARSKGKIVTRRLKRGKRKGQTVQGYIDRKGRFSEVKSNKSKKGPRSGKKFITTRDSKGRRVHTYADGKSVTLTKSRKTKDKGKIARGKTTRSSLRSDVKSMRKKQKPPSKKAAAKGGRKSPPPSKRAAAKGGRKSRPKGMSKKKKK